MKANESPEKLYIDSREHWRKSWTAFTTKVKGDDIEYTRTDAFIDKAEKFLWSHIEGSDYHVNYVLNEFEKYMKGEEV